MNFELTEEQIAVRDAARDFAKTELLPGVIERDTKQEFPLQQIRALGELGFMGMMVDPKYGGSGMDAVSYVLAMEEISKIDASCSVVMSVNNSLVCWGLETFGSEEQKMKYLVPLASGKVHGAFCLSEPEAGSDATSQRTTAIDKGDHYVINGTKWFTSSADGASFAIVMANTKTITPTINGAQVMFLDYDIESSNPNLNLNGDITYLQGGGGGDVAAGVAALRAATSLRGQLDALNALVAASAASVLVPHAAPRSVIARSSPAASRGAWGRGAGSWTALCRGVAPAGAPCAAPRAGDFPARPASSAGGRTTALH